MSNLIQEQIARLDQEIAENKTTAKRLRREIAELVQETDEFKEVQRLERELKVARTKLKLELQGNGQYNNLKSDQEDLKFKVKDLKDILSHHLVEYRITEQSSTVVTEPGVQKHIVLAGKLDKPEPENVRMDFAETEMLIVNDPLPPLKDIDKYDTRLAAGKWPARNKAQKAAADA